MKDSELGAAKPSTVNKFLAIGVPLVGRPVAPEWALAFRGLHWPLNYNVAIVPTKGMEVGEARNTIAKHAIDFGAKYLFFLDDDVAPPQHAIRHLMYALQNCDDPEKTMVAAGIYVGKWNPPEPFVFMDNGEGAYWRWKRGQVFECHMIGTGCMLINTEVFKHIPEPWFKTVDSWDENVPWKTEGAPVCGGVQVTDDLYFCNKVREAGFKILADGDVLPIHWDYKPVIGKTGMVTDWQAFPWVLPEGCYPLREPEEAPKIEEITTSAAT